MPTQRMRVHADFPTFANLSEDKKSLINFIMENGAVYLRGEYDDNTLLHMAGCLRPTTRVYYHGGDFIEVGSYDINVMYTEFVTYSVTFQNADNEEITVTLNSSIFDQDNYYLQIENDGNVGIWTLTVVPLTGGEVTVYSGRGTNISNLEKTSYYDKDRYITISPSSGKATTLDPAGLPKTQFTKSSQGTNPFDPSLLPDGGASISYIKNKYGDYSNIPELHYEDGVIDCNTVLCEAHTYLNLYKYGTADGPYYPTSEIATDDGVPFLSIPVTLTPKIGNVINTDPNVKPPFLLDKDENVDGLHLYEIPIDKEDMDFTYNLQVKSQDFWLSWTDPEEHTTLLRKVCYKIGFVSLNDNLSVNNMVNDFLSDGSFRIGRYTPYWERVVDENSPTGATIGIFGSNLATGSSYNVTSIYIEQRIGSYDIGGVAKTFITAIVETDYEHLMGLAYFKLYEYSGDNLIPFTHTILDDTFQLYETENGEAQSDLYLSILRA